MPRIGVITGTRREAACLQRHSPRDRFEIVCSGADAARARVQATTLLAAGCEALMSFGLAGGLDPALASGTLIVADTVITPGGSAIATDDSWRAAVIAAMRAAGIDFATGAVAGVDRPVADTGPKRLLFAGTGALGVDMESHAVMRAAQHAAVPGLVIRAIADSADDELPDVAVAAIGSRGEVRYATLAGALLQQPSGLGRLVRLARVSRPAFASLRRVALLPGLGDPL